MAGQLCFTKSPGTRATFQSLLSHSWSVASSSETKTTSGLQATDGWRKKYRSTNEVSPKEGSQKLPRDTPTFIKWPELGLRNTPSCKLRWKYTLSWQCEILFLWKKEENNWRWANSLWHHACCAGTHSHPRESASLRTWGL